MVDKNVDAGGKVSVLDDFEDVTGLTNGARFVRGDLHIHSNAGSHDVTDALATPSAIVDAAVAEGLKIIAVADHNEISGAVQAIAAAKGKPIFVVPAIELSTMQGHLLCYLPDVDRLQTFHSQLSLRDRSTANSRVENAMVDCLNKLLPLGGFGILAHVDAPKGLDTEMPGGSPHKRDIIGHPALLAIELKSAASTITFTADDPDNVRADMGRDRAGRNGGSLMPLARILNSDAHTLKALGRNAKGDTKVTRYKVQNLSFDALRYALSNADARVRLEDEIPRQVPTLLGLRLEGCFLRDQAIHFSPNLTCIIGGRGTGKSTMFEALRFFSGYPSGNSVINSDVWPDRINLAYIDPAGAPHRLFCSKGDETGTNLHDPLEGPEVLPIECYGQGETQRISQKAQDDPGALLSYLDRFTNVAEEILAEEKARTAIAAIEVEITEARGKIALIPQYRRDLAIVQQQIKKFTDGKAKQIIETSRQLEGERQSRNQIVTLARNIATSLDYKQVKESLAKLRTAADASTLVVGKDEFLAITAEADAFESGLTQSEAIITVRSNSLSTLVQAKIEAWSGKEKVLLATLQNQRAALEAAGITVNMNYISKLTKDEATYTAGLTNLQAWAPHLEQLEKRRDGLVADRWAARKEICAKRKKFATMATTKLRAALSDLNVTLKFEESGFSPEAHELLVEIMGWRTTQVPRATCLTQRLTVPKLLAAIRAKDSASIQAVRTVDDVSLFNRAEAEELIKRFQEPANLARLETVQVFDRPKLTVTRPHEDPSGKKSFLVREFGQLSLGQQQSVLLALMLSSENINPLLIDQPEDNLDSEFIFSQLVPVIRMAKERRQIIIVTHNPNIAVLGDAEQIVVLKATSERSLIIARGSIDDTDMKDAACAILEGAKAAFMRRGQVYGLVPIQAA
ncbi:AAA family ATPase [Sphingobium sp. 3R8]|uniref:TrlF family AAA-like ATPase n=1 Tax=Sphingobium sp. 3R8 TaxID=2874921 RepID=UPI001CCFEEE4|nr:AAA family ATPase [Sphingobium sp. 3R8]MBZ9649953.1 AAA family ATPase [Sphingobium sp. 3R8]